MRGSTEQQEQQQKKRRSAPYYKGSTVQEKWAEKIWQTRKCQKLFKFFLPRKFPQADPSASFLNPLYCTLESLVNHKLTRRIWIESKISSFNDNNPMKNERKKKSSLLSSPEIHLSSRYSRSIVATLQTDTTASAYEKSLSMENYSIRLSPLSLLFTV